MIIARTRKDLNKTLQRFSQKPGKLALIPTMGNLHDGHLSLIRLAKLNAEKTKQILRHKVTRQIQRQSETSIEKYKNK